MRIPQIWPLCVGFGWAFAASAVAGQPYKCVGPDGKIVFTDQKCTADAKPVRIWDSNLGGAVSDAGAAPGVAGGAPANDQQAAILHRCESQWPGDFRMQEYCANQQKDAARAMKSVVNDSADEETKLIVGTCATQWKQGDTYDFRMMKYCYDQQSEARQRLSK